MSTILVTSDWHADAITAGVSRYREIQKVTEVMLDTVTREGVKTFLFLGDLCNPDKGLRTLKAIKLAAAVANVLSRMGVMNIWIAGNHDVVNSNEGITTLGVIPEDDFTRVVEWPKVVLAYGVPVLCLPYLAKANRVHSEDMSLAVEGLFREIPTAQHSKTIVAGHATQVEGAQMGTESRDYRRGADYALPVPQIQQYCPRLILNGHYHTRQQVGPVLIPGAPARLDFGEQNNVPAFYLLHNC